MAKIIFNPQLILKSIGGFNVVIESADPTLTTDQICGEISTLGSGIIKAQWNEAGIMRGGTNSTNLDMRNIPSNLKNTLGI